jgi:hypothetical protein
MKNTEICKHCREEIKQDAQGSWVDATDGDGCLQEDNTNQVHELAPDEIDCANCGSNTIPFTNDTDDTCGRCIAEWEQEKRDREWDYWHA